MSETKLYTHAKLGGGTLMPIDKSRKYMRRVVKRGAAWLDVQNPRWRDRFDTSEFNMRNADTCVFGQNFDVRIGFYLTDEEIEFLEELTGETGRDDIILWLQKHGFLAWNSGTTYSWDAYDNLQDQWLRELVNDKTVEFTKKQAIETLNNMLNKHDYIGV